MNEIRLSQSIIGSAEADAVSRIINDDGYLGMGEEVKFFESEIAAYLNVPVNNVTCVNSGTAALHLAVDSMLVPHDEVLIQSLTYVASFQAISAASVKPIACEVNPDTMNIDLEDARCKLTENTQAIMPVHFASNPGDLDEIYRFADDNNLRVIEDAAHAFGCTYRDKKIGSFGDVVCFSFDGIKNITSGEGGVIISSDSDFNQLVKDARLLGVHKDSEKRYRGERSWEFDVYHQGYRYHMSNLNAAIGRVQLKRLDNEFAIKRKDIAKKYSNNFTKNKNVKVIYNNSDEIIPHIYPIIVNEHRRDILIAELKKNNIQSGVHYKPNHMLSLYKDINVSLPITEQLYKGLLSIPLHPNLNKEQVDLISDIVNRVTANKI